MRLEKGQNPISRVKCVVNTCGFYESGDHCNASEIEIQPRNARNTEETDCATFYPKHES